MALIKSKQIKSVVAEKVTTNAQKQFVSDVEKASFLDKYSKTEIDDKTVELTNKEAADITEVKGEITTKTAALDTKITTVSDSLSTTSASLTQQMSTLNTNIQSQITNAIAGLTWKTPVANFAAIATTYTTPKEGWMVTVDDTNKVYRYDAGTSLWVEFPLQVPTSYSKSIIIMPTENQTAINTGIRNDGTGVYKTGHADIELAVNGHIQQPGVGKDYTTDFVNHELVITWLNRSYTLDADDELTITYTHFDIV